MKQWVLSAAFVLWSGPLLAQDWGNLDALLFPNLTNSGSAAASYWLPNAADPAQATVAVGVVYEHIPGSAGSVGIAVGVFAKQADGWAFAGPVSGVFGQSPKDAAFGNGFVDITTVLPGPGEPRCCPTMATRWRINLATLTGARVQ